MKSVGRHVVLRTGCNVVMVAGFAMGFKCTAIFFIGVIPLNLLVHSLHSNFHTRFFNLHDIVVR